MTTTNLDKAMAPSGIWMHACEVEDLVYNSGICALLNDKQIAIFAVFNSTVLQDASADNPSFGNEKQTENISLYACDNYDPIGHANVLSRGLICSIKDEVCISSPLYKQHFSLVTGECLEQPEYQVTVYSVKLEDGQVYVNLPVHEPLNEATSDTVNDVKSQQSSLPC